jgi:outer membrane protein
VAYGKAAESADAEVRRARAAFFPQASAVARYEQLRPNNLFFPPEDEWNADAFAGVAIQWNLLDWGLARSRTAEVEARREQARLRAGQADERIVLQVREARIGLQNATDRLALARRAEESAGHNLKVATDLWQSGLARHSDVLDAHARLTDAQYDAVAAAADVVLAQAAMKHATGRLHARDPR